ncbi:HDOD domain-containing protein [Thermodesulforhabdus norvegica]|uniref:HDIG domain-containing protein n=1 Tax=Thermodesulforhabdus norvegica TaxID=39841 RepID=A0A1I4S5J8_9BACT|nr:HDOD domain-containing protein [Thermodesulforhabdus norvegica]SFM59540.1 HDIG domain-containing protein [Thermodesulforhabdus norvegica]
MKASPLLKKIVSVTGDLPTIPHTAQLVMQKLSDPEVSPKELEKIILQDPALTARILKLANSPFYGRPRTIKTVSEATVVIGLNTLKSIVVASAVREMIKPFGLTEKLLWEHSVSVGFIVRYLAEKLRFRRTEEAFLAGLLHDIGKVVLQLKAPSKMYIVIQELYTGAETDSIGVENLVFGFAHVHVGQLLARKWQFAQEIEEAIGYHHWPGRAKISPELAHLVHLGNSFAHKLEIGPIKTPDLDLAEQVSARFFQLDQELIEEFLNDCSSKIQNEMGDILS